ncbi:uncharacterized protein [Rutidosis leptorrhynchoides]|uniref:uncharacterized protein n=1 Tax=Rutidosis leptorrhynchoides TaxID=125765 RepID=UPI003A995437
MIENVSQVSQEETISKGLADVMRGYIYNQTELNNVILYKISELYHNHQSLILNLEKDLRTLSKQLAVRETGILPSNTLENPRGNLEIQAITTRSGKTTQDPVISSQEEKHEPPNEASTTKSNDETPLKIDLPFKIDQPLEPVPYPQQLRKAKQQKRIENFANMFNNINVNIPLIDLLKENSHYGKYLKTLLSNKGRDAEKLGNAGSITVSCSCNDSTVYQALADTGAIPPKLELKELPSHLEYIFLKDYFELPVIISSELSINQKEQLLEALKKYKKAFAWKTSDIPGIDPTFCTHKILLEENAKPVIQRQRRLNPNMAEVVKMEVLILLDAGMIYPISDSQWEKCHFMVKEGIVLGHKISRKGIEVDKAKINVISNLPEPANVKAIKSFLGHAGFYRRFIQDFSNIARPLTKLLEKDAPFEFNEDCKKAFSIFKDKLTNTPIIVSPDWSKPFELMCDASDYAIGAVLGQRKEKTFIQFIALVKH